MDYSELKKDWSQAESELGAQVIKRGFLKQETLRYKHKFWTIDLVSYFGPQSKRNHTDLISYYIINDTFRFKTYREGISAALGKMILGMQDIEIGHPEFDEKFIVKGTDESILKQLFDNEDLRNILLELYQFQYENSYGEFGVMLPDDTYVLKYISFGQADFEQIKLLFKLFSETLDQLCSIGVAKQKSPDLSSYQ